MLAVFAQPAAALAADNLSVPLFSDQSEALWPVEVTMEIVPLSQGASIDTPVHRIVVADGQHLDFEDVIRTPAGQCSFDLRVVARHHANDAVEVEYDLRVAEARYQDMSWSDYLMHRLNLAPRPEVGPSLLSVARADIVAGAARTHSERIEVGGETFEIRISAKSMRG
jgi:hypothetical protein